MTALFAWLTGHRTPPSSPQGARRRAARGAAYLDDVDPGWHRRLDLDALALADGRSCVLGQLHGTFRSGLGRARLFHPGSAPRASLSPVAYGFHCIRADDEDAERRDYRLLDRAWEEEVRRRQQRPADRGEGGASGRQTPSVLPRREGRRPERSPARRETEPSGAVPA